MHRSCVFLSACLVFISTLASPLKAQFDLLGVDGSRARILSTISDGELATLSGNIHPLASSENDQGRVSGALPMERMLLMLQGTAEQQAAKEELEKEQLDPASPHFHDWLSPREFGERFGPSGADVEMISGWLRSRGFRVTRVMQGRQAIEFSGSVAQVEAAFHTEIHRFLVGGREHYANRFEPQIPIGLTPVVSGLVSLHNFHSRPMHVVQAVDGGLALPMVAPDYNDGGGNHFLTPYDFATIYNIAPLWKQGVDGTGQKIAIVGRSNINLRDVASFRSNFGAPLNDPVIIVDGQNPGETLDGDEEEADLDVEWSGSVAKNATIDFVVAASTNTSDGSALSALYIVDNNVAPVMSMSFGLCEAQLGTSGNQFYRSLWQQAAMQGISVFVSTGDSGSAGCDPTSGSNPAQYGLAVSGLSSTPYNVAVGGSEFNEAGQGASYWSVKNGLNDASVKSYIPEKAWNDSGYDAFGTYYMVGGGGGVSSVYATPSWQTGMGVPVADPSITSTAGQHHRYVPDVSLTASASHDGYWVASDVSQTGFEIIGGTSAAAPAFAGIMALVNQYSNSPQGFPNPRFYSLLSVSGVFHDVPAGSSNGVPCQGGSVNCSSKSATQNGVMNGFNTGAGYDLATGLGSVNAYNLVQSWHGAKVSSTTVLTASSNSSQQGIGISLFVRVTGNTGSGIPSGNINLMRGSNLLGTYTLDAGGLLTVSGVQLPGGANTITAQYLGNGTYAGSVSAPFTINIATITPTTTTLKIGSSTTSQSGALTFTAVVTAKNGTPSGNVKLYQGVALIGTATLDGHGSATFVVGRLASGKYSFTAVYPGNAVFGPSTSAAVLVKAARALQVSDFRNDSH